MGTDIAERLSIVTDRISRAARKAGRYNGEVTLVCVTKYVELKRIKEAIKAGARTFGENYIQEAKAKVEALKRRPVKWHFIGHLQKNKAKPAVELFDMVETVDSVELAEALSKRAKEAPLDILVEVNLARERSKAGFTVKGLERGIRKIAQLENLRIKGLMAIPPFHESPEASRPYFVTLRRLAERMNKLQLQNVSMHELSMGMSEDFEVAIEEGATIVRVGRAIFGERPATAKSTK